MDEEMDLEIVEESEPLSHMIGKVVLGSIAAAVVSKIVEKAFDAVMDARHNRDLDDPEE